MILNTSFIQNNIGQESLVWLKFTLVKQLDKFPYKEIYLYSMYNILKLRRCFFRIV